jgi:hypothetical protein
MDTHIDSGVNSRVTQPWNKGKLTGAKPPLTYNRLVAGARNQRCLHLDYAPL